MKNRFNGKYVREPQNNRAVSVIIPVFNESDNIVNVLNSFPKQIYEIIVSDDGSTDDTENILKNYNIKYIRSNKNKGKGHSIIRGTKNATGKYLVFIDGDNQHNPQEVDNLLTLMKSENFDLVIGKRNFNQIPLLNRLANISTKYIIQLITGKRISDPLSGFRVIHHKSFRKLNLQERGYEFEIEMIFKSILNNMKIAEVPISINYPKNKKGMRLSHCLILTKFIVLESLKYINKKRIFTKKTY